MIVVCLNGKILPSTEPLFTLNNRSFKWGDGVFETMKVYRGSILLGELHFERLLVSLKLLLIDMDLNREYLEERIIFLCEKNNCSELARVRLAVYRNEDGKAAFSIEAIPLPTDTMKWSLHGLRLAIYPFARKANDAFANLKSASFLPYVMASLHAQQNSCDDALVLNSENAIADSSRANLFLFKNNELFTPALHQGCVNGVMRRYLLENCKKHGIIVHQNKITEAELLEADEVFLTNAIQGIRWVKRFKEKEYGFEKTLALYHDLLSPLYSL